jgi:hypothetical protein
MEKVIFPLYTLPPLDYLQALLQQEIIYISIGENFQKQTFRSRFEIMSPNKRQLLSIPLEKGKSSLRMEEVKISYAEPWQRKHWNAIETAYDNSPFFPYFDYKIKPVFMETPDFLWQYNFALLQNILACLKCTKKIEITPGNPNVASLIAAQKVQQYDQVFSDRHPFMPNLSILDWLFNNGV